MSNTRRIGLIFMAAVLGFSCAPVLSPALIPTLDPFSMSTAIALTADAASAQTAAAAQPEVVQATPILVSGPTLDPQEMGTSIALTAGAASTQTAAMIPPTLTPSVTSMPTQTASITPSPTATFYLIIPNTATPFKIDIPQATATKKKKGGGGGGGVGGGGGGGGGGSKKIYGCSVQSVMPENNTIIPPNTLFTAYWTVKNTESNWDAQSVDLVPAGGNITYLVDGIDLENTISGGTTLVLPGAPLLSPGIPGAYNTHWQLQRGSISFCDMYLTIIVQ